MDRMMSNGSVVSVAVMALFTMRDMLIELQVVMIVQNSTFSGCVVGFDLWGEI